MKTVDVPALPAPNGHYAHAITHGELVLVSGQLPIDPETGTPPEGFERQAHLALARLDRVLTAAGSAPDKVLQVRIYIVGVEHWGTMNACFAEAFGEHRPARAIVPVPELHYGCLLEIEATAIVTSS